MYPDTAPAASVGTAQSVSSAPAASDASWERVSATSTSPRFSNLTDDTVGWQIWEKVWNSDCSDYSGDAPSPAQGYPSSSSGHAVPVQALPAQVRSDGTPKDKSPPAGQPAKPKAKQWREQARPTTSAPVLPHAHSADMNTFL